MIEKLSLDEAGTAFHTLTKAGKRWCAREDLNLQSFRNQILSLARLPFRHARPDAEHACSGSESQATRRLKENHEWTRINTNVPEEKEPGERQTSSRRSNRKFIRVNSCPFVVLYFNHGAILSSLQMFFTGWRSRTRAAREPLTNTSAASERVL